MSKDSNNPFAVLNARDFPSDRKSVVVRKKQSKTVLGKKNRVISAEDTDAELFLQAMGENTQVWEKQTSVSALKSRSTDGKHYRDNPDDFAKLLKQQGIERATVKRKSDQMVGAAVSVPDDNTGEDSVPTTLTAMARAGSRIAKHKTQSLMAEAVGQSEVSDDKDDFLSAVKGTKPLSMHGRDIPAEPETPPIPVHDPRHPLQDFMEGKVEFTVASTDEYAEGHILGLDLMIVSQLQSRQFSPEAHIDLHGLNSEQAFQNLVGFFRRSYYKGVRVALVVTGRGLNSLNGMPVLRNRVQEWFTQDPFKRVVLAFCTAKQEDGGAGAFYVLMRKYKKSSGKIRWDAMPSDPDLYL